MMLMSGCGKDGGSAQQETATKNADGKYEPTLTITIAKQLDENTGRYGDGEDINNNPMTRLTEEKLGLKMETTLLGGDASNYDTKLRLALTGSEKLPDIFPVYGTQMICNGNCQCRLVLSICIFRCGFLLRRSTILAAPTHQHHCCHCR